MPRHAKADRKTEANCDKQGREHISTDPGFLNEETQLEELIILHE